jgi:hypothetical protein
MDWVGRANIIILVRDLDFKGLVNIIIFVRDLDFKFGNLFRLIIFFGIKDDVKTFLFYACAKYLQD